MRTTSQTSEAMIVRYATIIRLFLVPPILVIFLLLTVIIVQFKALDWQGEVVIAIFGLGFLVLAIAYWYKLRRLGYAIVHVTVADCHAYFIKFASGPEMKGKECKTPQFLSLSRWISFLLGSFEKWIDTPITFNMDLLGQQWAVTASLKPDRIVEAYHTYGTSRELEDAIQNFIIVATRDTDPDNEYLEIRVNEAIQRRSEPKKDEQPRVFSIGPIREFVCMM